MLPEVVERHCVDVFPGEALRDDDREGEAFVFHAPEKGPPVANNVAVDERLPVTGGEVYCEEAPRLVVLDRESIGLVRELDGEGVGHLARINLDDLDLVSKVDKL